MLHSMRFQCPQKRQRTFLLAMEVWNSGLSPDLKAAGFGFLAKRPDLDSLRRTIQCAV